MARQALGVATCRLACGHKAKGSRLAWQSGDWQLAVGSQWLAGWCLT